MQNDFNTMADKNDTAKGYISEIVFNNNKKIDINRNDIVVFVGPNNVGKSQSLSDIYNLTRENTPTVVVKHIKINKSGNLLHLLKSTSSINHQNGEYTVYSAMGKDAIYNGFIESNFLKTPFYGDYRDWFVLKLNTETRLSICKPPQNIIRRASWTNPIHYAQFDPECRRWLSENFKRAFGVDVIPNVFNGATVPLSMGEPVILTGEYENEQVRTEKYGEIISSYKQVQDQGDGIKSFTGILLNLMLRYYCTYLIDEPESFLHPPQARIMGQVIGENISEEQQAFISTHSEDVLKGLLETAPDRLKIIRITREGDMNSFAILDNANVSKVFGDPLLKYSNIMTSLFHKTVVLCESDSDCKLYSVIENHIKQQEGKYSETLYIHCGGKHRMAKIARALKELEIDVRLIPDLDVMNDENVFKDILSVFGIEWGTVEKDYHIIVSNLHSEKEKINRSEIKQTINYILDKSSSVYLNNDEINNIEATIKTVSKWKKLKEAGVSAFPAGDATQSYKTIESILKKHKIYLVRVGELEGFIKEVGGHGPEWINNVLEKYPDLDSEVYDDVKNFIKGLDL